MQHSDIHTLVLLKVIFCLKKDNQIALLPGCSGILHDYSLFFCSSQALRSRYTNFTLNHVWEKFDCQTSLLTKEALLPLAKRNPAPRICEFLRNKFLRLGCRFAKQDCSGKPWETTVFYVVTIGICFFKGLGAS